MSFFDDIGAAVGGAIGDVGGAIGGVVGGATDVIGWGLGAARDVVGYATPVLSGIVNNPLGQFGLGAVGSIFGDPMLGTQLGGALKGINSLFSGSPGRPNARQSPPPPRGFSSSPFAPGINIPSGVPVFPGDGGKVLPRPAGLRKVTIAGRTLLLTDTQLRALVEGIKRLQAAQRAKREVAIALRAKAELASVDVLDDPDHLKEAHAQTLMDEAAAEAARQSAIAGGQPPPQITVIAQQDVVPPPVSVVASRTIGLGRSIVRNH